MKNKECINPDESMAELIKAKRILSRKYHEMNNGTIPASDYERPTALRELNRVTDKLKEVEHAGQTGGIIRIM